ncbi:MAG: SPASM domain-containing protein [Clostridia bacterium]
MFKKVYVEITNVCNLNCKFCIKNSRCEKFISMDEFNIILDKLYGYTKYLYLHILGEPLMHPLINELIDVADEKKFFINITTNGYLIKKIKTKNIRQINISLHSFDGCNGLSLNEYLSNIFFVVDSLKEKTFISYRLWTKTKYQDLIIKELNKKYNCDINGNMKLEKNVFIHFDSEFVWPSLDNELEEDTGFCYALRDHLGVLVNGDIVPCCLDTKGDITLGNIYKGELKSVIESKRYQDMLNGFKNNKKVEKLCCKCNFIKKEDD